MAIISAFLLLSLPRILPRPFFGASVPSPSGFSLSASGSFSFLAMNGLSHFSLQGSPYANVVKEWFKLPGARRVARQDFPHTACVMRKTQQKRAFFAGTAAAMWLADGPERIRGRWIIHFSLVFRISSPPIARWT